MKKLKTVAVCGSSGHISDQVQMICIELGKNLAENGYNLVCGGRDGVMESVCRGFSQADNAQGTCIGILPGLYKEEANQYCQLVIPTGLGFARNSLVVLSADAVVVVQGASGTLSEVAYAWQFGKPLASLKSTGGVATRVADTRIDDRREDKIEGFTEIDELIAWINRRVKGDR
ncbi:MAG: TIGR00725 family protein [Myxococcota bacterium]